MSTALGMNQMPCMIDASWLVAQSHLSLACANRLFAGGRCSECCNASDVPSRHQRVDLHRSYQKQLQIRICERKVNDNQCNLMRHMT
jgi:hypothetical protein